VGRENLSCHFVRIGGAVVGSGKDGVLHEAMEVGNVGDFGREGGLIGEEGGVAVGIVRVVAVHGADGSLTHVTGDDEDAFLHEKDEFAELPVIKMGAQVAELVVRYDAPFFDSAEGRGDETAGLVIEEPEAGHGAVVDDGVVLPEGEGERVDGGFEIEVDVAVGHAVITEDVKSDVVVVLETEPVELGYPLLVNPEFGGDFGRIVADAVEQSVEPGPVKKGKVEILFRDAVAESGEVTLFGRGGIADEIGCAL
jgi:hypothetical protein